VMMVKRNNGGEKYGDLEREVWGMIMESAV